MSDFKSLNAIREKRLFDHFHIIKQSTKCLSIYLQKREEAVDDVRNLKKTRHTIQILFEIAFFVN